MKETVLQNFIINKMTQEQYDEALKSGAVKDDELYLTDFVASGGGGVQIYDASEYIKGVAKIATSSEAKQGYNDNTIMTPLKTKQVIGDNIGRLNQLGYIGTLAGGVLTFEQPSDETPYELKVGYEYLVDLLFEAVGEISDDVQIVIKNGGSYINLVNVLHDDTVNPMTIGDIKQVMKYSIDLGWRWLFKAWYTETQAGAKVLVMPSTVVDTISEDTDNTFTGVNTFKGDNHPVVIEGMAGTTATGLQIVDSLGVGETDVEHYRSGNMYVSRLLNRNKIADKDSYIDLYTTDAGVSVLDESMVDSVLVPTPDSSDNTKRAINTEYMNSAEVKSKLSSYAMPSDRYIALTVGASGSTYTAPANGYFTFFAIATSDNIGYVSAAILPSNSESAIMRLHNWIPSGAKDNNLRGFIPCKKGQRFYTGMYNIEIKDLLFVYAEGEN
jgi:hypothetical protein